MYNGIINVYKEAGYTSFDVVAKLRGILHQKKIGHTGTLDPEATGVLPVCLGNATRICELMNDETKTYRAILKLGINTDTEDLTGKVLETFDVKVSKEEILDAVDSFKGEIMQIPPMYSALKVNGKKLYELAREGKTIERKPRPVTVFDISVLNIDMENYEVCFDVTCSKGTYIRTLCFDIGKKLSCGGAMKSLVRTRVACFEIENALKLEEIEKVRDEGKLDEIIVPVDRYFDKYPKVIAKNEEEDRLIKNGNKIKLDVIPDIIRMYDVKGN
ncbi:MAG: tRNA pseudouridine(55) synthase TruB, partial [Lachnospiraceae bacterium]|nr:tRNA pseudouridine(55) synthase TruB [Lachnospiraceae bacterium]